MTPPFKLGDWIVRTHDNYRSVAKGQIVKVVATENSGVRVAHASGMVLDAVLAYEKFRIATKEEIERMLDAIEPCDPAFVRDGMTRSQARILACELSAPVVKRATPSVRYSFRKNPPVRKPTVHPMPHGWKYSCHESDVEGFDVLVRPRPAGWTPF